MTCECGKDPCCCASITGIKGGIHPDAIKTIHMDLTLEEADASQTITHISKVLLNEPCHIVGFDASLVTIKRDIATANAAKQIEEAVETSSEYAIRANTPVNVSLYTIPSWSSGDLQRGGFGAIAQEQDRYYISTASLTAQNPHWTAHEDLFGYFADGSLFVEYNSPSDQYGVRIVVRYVPRLQFTPAYCDPIEVMQHYWKCCHGDKEFLEGFYGGTLLTIPSVSSFSAASAGDSPPATSYAPSDNPTIGTQLDYSFVGEVPPPPLLLDDYSGAYFAGGVRKLRNDYGGYCMRVREDSGNTETDIGFDGDGNVNSAAIASHCGSANGYVVKLYDQSGNSRDLHQTTTTLQPKIYDGSAVITAGGIAAMDSNSGTARLYSSTTINIGSTTPTTTLSVSQGAGGQYATPLWKSTSSHFVIRSSSDSRYTHGHRLAQVSGAAPTNVIYVLLGDESAASMVNGTEGATSTENVGVAWSFISWGGRYNSNEGADASKKQELVIWASDKYTDNASGISSNANAYYSIY